MLYFFVLGNHPALSIAEIQALLPEGKSFLPAPDVLLLDLDRELSADSLIKRLGGTIKFGLIEDKVAGGQGVVIKSLTAQVDALSKKPDFPTGKFNFGLSFYGSKPLNLKIIGLEVKSFLKSKGVSSRLVVSREANLSSVVVTQNKLLGKGLEVVLIRGDKEILIGRTLAVQDFKGLSHRDYGRPKRDDHSGMLPPKLAQMMINLAGGSDWGGDDRVLLDPFCGSGTVLTEALLMGYSEVIGSDVSKTAIDNSRDNLKWVIDNFHISGGHYRLFKKNVLDLSKFIKKESIDLIVTEPYLGPQRNFFQPTLLSRELNDLYSQALAEFFIALKPGGRVVMVWPVFFNKHFLNPELGGFKMISPLPQKLLTDERLTITKRQTIVYGRPGQKMYREIVILEKA